MPSSIYANYQMICKDVGETLTYWRVAESRDIRLMNRQRKIIKLQWDSILKDRNQDNPFEEM